MKKANCILLIDDNPTTTFLHQQLINKLNITHQLLTARNGKIALELLEQRYLDGQDCPELILLDINMPVMDGYEFFKAYQQFEWGKQVSTKVVVLTSALASKDIERAKDAGIQYFINKPLTTQKLNDIWPMQITKLI